MAATDQLHFFCERKNLKSETIQILYHIPHDM